MGEGIKWYVYILYARDQPGRKNVKIVLENTVRIISEKEAEFSSDNRKVKKNITAFEIGLR